MKWIDKYLFIEFMQFLRSLLEADKTFTERDFKRAREVLAKTKSSPEQQASLLYNTHQNIKARNFAAFLKELGINAPIFCKQLKRTVAGLDKKKLARKALRDAT